jgi:hypothetical protein
MPGWTISGIGVYGVSCALLVELAYTNSITPVFGLLLFIIQTGVLITYLLILLNAASLRMTDRAVFGPFKDLYNAFAHRKGDMWKDIEGAIRKGVKKDMEARANRAVDDIRKALTEKGMKPTEIAESVIEQVDAPVKPKKNWEVKLK